MRPAYRTQGNAVKHRGSPRYCKNDKSLLMSLIFSGRQGMRMISSQETCLFSHFDPYGGWGSVKL